MANIRKYKIRRVKIAGGAVEPVDIQQGGVNVIRFINWGASDLRASLASNPQAEPMVICAGNGGTNNLMDPAGISRVYVYAAGPITFGLVEMDVEDPMLILAMESVVSNLLTALPAGTAHVGQVGIDVANTPVSENAPFPVLSKPRATGSATWTGVGSGQAKGTPGRLYGVEVAAAAGVCTVRIRDGGVGGTVRAIVQAAANGFEPLILPVPREFGTNIYVDISGTAPTAVVVHYE